MRAIFWSTLNSHGFMCLDSRNPLTSGSRGLWGPWRPGYPLPSSFSKSGSFQAILREKPLFWAQGPPWGQNPAGPQWPISWICRWHLYLTWLISTVAVTVILPCGSRIFISHFSSERHNEHFSARFQSLPTVLDYFWVVRATWRYRGTSSLLPGMDQAQQLSALGTVPGLWAACTCSRQVPCIAELCLLTLCCWHRQ